MDRQDLVAILVPLLRNIESAHESAWIAEHVLKNGPAATAVERAHEIVARRAQGEPLAYIFGSWAFREHEFAVGPGALVPRPETEELVEHSLREIERLNLTAQVDDEFVIADFGAGTGCIGLSLVTELLEKSKGDISRLLLHSVERSPEARVWLRKNIASFESKNPQMSVALFEGSWQEWPLHPLHVMLSNPPYVTRGEFDVAEKSVTEFEPLGALVPSDIASFDDASGPYRELLDISAKSLRTGGLLGFELGTTQPAWIENYAAGLGAFREIKILQDMSGKPRFFFAVRSGE